MKITKKISRFAQEPLIEKFESLSHLYWLLKTQFYYRHYFLHIGGRSRIIKPLRIKNPERISIGNEVLIHKYCWMQTQQISERYPSLSFGDGCVVGNFNHITCVEEVRIEEKVLTADRVFISDHGHQFSDPLIPIVDQGVRVGKPVVIGKGSWLGENVSVISSRIGKKLCHRRQLGGADRHS